MSLEAFGVAAGVVVGSGVVVQRAGVGHRPDRGQEGVLDRDDGLLRAASCGDAAVLRGQVGAVGVGDRERGRASAAFR